MYLPYQTEFLGEDSILAIYTLEKDAEVAPN